MGDNLKLQFDINNNVEDFTLILSTKWYEHYGEIANVKRDTVHCKQNLNGANELSFEVCKTLDNKDERLWNNINNFKSVWVKELNEYYEINVSLDDSVNPTKIVTGTSLCEAELSQVNLYNIEINTEVDIERTDYVETKFYNPDNIKGSLLHRIMDKVPHYTIKHVDTSLMNLQRTFSIDGTDLYGWLVGECSEQFNCLFTFDTTDRSISVYDLYTVCRSCGHRGEFNDVCPECNSTDLKYFGEDTTVYISKENLTESVKLEVDTGSIKNCFKLEAGDDDMTAAVRNINPVGNDYIIYVSDWQKEDMPDELVEKIESYDELVQSYTDEYEQLAEDIYEKMSNISYYKHSMMPTIEHAEVTANIEAAKLTKANLSPLALTSVTKSTSKDTVESSLKNYAKVYIKAGYVKLEINQSSFTYKQEGSGTWTGNFKVINYSDEEDVAYSSVITIDVNDNYEEFIKQKVMKAMTEDDKEGSVFDVLSIENLNEFKNALKLYSLVRLESFHSAIDGALNALQQLNQASEEADFYSSIYLPYYEKLQACENEIDVRSKTIENLEKELKTLNTRKSEIQKKLNFEDYLGEELYSIFCLYRREDKYSNENYISDGLEDKELFDNARKFIKTAKEELYKASMCKYSISSTLYNLLIMPEFQVITDKFELGNWIRVCADGEIYRLRLIGYEINFSDIQTLNVEFSEITKQKNCVSDLENILNSAQSMASNFSYVSKQAEKGETTYKTFNEVQEEGWNSALTQINNNKKQEVTFGAHGILCRSYDDFIDDYSLEQLKLTHNILCFTDDNWKSVKTALGKHDYYKYTNGVLDKHTGYGLTSEFVTSGYIFGSQIIAGEIYSVNYSPTSGTYLNLNDGSFSFAGGNIAYNSSLNEIKLKGVEIDWSTSTTPEITDIEGLNDYLEQLDGRIQTYSQPTDPSINWTAIEKAEKVGDLWFDTTNSLTKRWNGSSWDVVTDSELEALAKSKAQIFTTTPTTPYYVGDLWVQGASGDIMNCIKTRTSGNYVASDWEKSSKYTDDTALKTFIEGSYADTIKEINTQVDKRAQTWYLTKAQMDAEVATWTDKSIHVGDLWYRTDAAENSDQTFMYNSSYEWEVVNGVPKEIFDMADAKCSLYVSKPSNYKAKDMWILEVDNTTGSNTTYPKYEKGTLLVSSKDNTGYSVSDWSEIVKYSNKLEDFINNTYASALEDIQGQIDAKADSYYQSTMPHPEYTKVDNNTTYNNYVGDLWFNTTNDKSYTYVKVTNSSNGAKYDYKWVETDGVPDEVYDLIDGKATIYVSKPSQYNVGDLLIPNSDFTVSNITFIQGKVYKANATATSFSASDWVEIKYTDDTSLNAFINGDYASALEDINTQIDGKANTFYQSTKPRTEYTNVKDNATYNSYVGDLWFDTSNNKSYMYTKVAASTSGYYNYTWKEIDGVPDEIYDKIDGKATVYVSKPSSQNSGDLLIPSSTFTATYSSKTYTFTAKKIYRCTTTSTTFRPDYWIEVAYTDDTKADEAYTLADTAKGVADNAKTIGDTLVNGLGFKETSITGNYVISPVIAGGTLLIGDTSGTYAQITTDGKLICTGASINGAITATSLNLVGCSLSSSDINDLDNTIKNYGYQTAEQAKKIIEAYGYQTDTNVKDIVTSYNYQDATKVKDIVEKYGYTTNSAAYQYLVDGKYFLVSGTKLSEITGYTEFKDSLVLKSSISSTSKKETITLPSGEKVERTTYTTIVPNSDGTSQTFNTYDDGAYVFTNIGIGKGSSDPENSSSTDTYVMIDKNGCLTADNAVIRGNIYAINGYFNGTVHATNGSFNGEVTASKLTLGTDVKIDSGKVDGLSKVATSGKYSDLSGNPDLSTYVTNSSLTTKLNDYAKTGALADYLKTNDLNAKLGDLKVAYRGDVTLTQTKDSTTGITTTKSTYIGSDGKTYSFTTYTTDGGNYVLLNRTNQWTNSDGSNLVKIESNGLLTAKNALIYGTVYATDGEFNGKVTASSGQVGGWTITSGKIYGGDSTTGVAVMQLPSANTSWVFAAGGTSHSDYGSGTSACPFRVHKDGSLYTSKLNASGGKISGSLEITGSLYHKSSDGNYQVTLRGVQSTLTNGIFYITDNSSGTAKYPFRVNGDGSVSASKLTVTGGSLNIGSGTFKVTDTGALTATSATITGVLTCSKGSSIGGFETDNNSIFSGGDWSSSNDKTPTVFMSTGSNNSYTIGGKKTSGWCFGAGGKFGVTKNGAMYATSGKIGGWTIGESLYADLDDGGRIALYPQYLQYTDASGYSQPISWKKIANFLINNV